MIKSALLALTVLATASLSFGQSLTGSIDPIDPNDVLLVPFTLSAPGSLNVQSFGYGGSGNAPGGTNAAGMVIAPGGFDPYISLFSGVGPSATFVASNDDGLCPPGTATGAFCPDSTLHINSLPAGSYILAVSVFDNFSFAENLGTGTLGDLFIGLGNYYDAISNTVRTSNYAIDFAATGLQIGPAATLDVTSPPVISKVFTPTKLALGGTAILSFTLQNPNPLYQLTGVTFTDPFPAGLKISTPNGLTGSCGGGVIAALAGSDLITLTGASLAPQSTCTFGLAVTSDGTVLGNVTNTTSPLTSNEAPPGTAASAILAIVDPLEVRYTANLNIGESYLDITNTGANGASLQGPGFGTPVGSICANVYAIDPNEELIACCSCLITPDETVNLGVVSNLISKSLTGVVPTSVTVKLLATAPGLTAGSNPTQTVCTNSAATATNASLANGLAAWGTTLHAMPTGLNYATTETPFAHATLSPGELTSLAGRCAAIIGNGSGFGICSSCQSGALGGTKF